MHRKSLVLTFLITCLLTGASIAHALTVAYGQRDIAEAGVGCVGGRISAHGNTAYYRGDTETLNRHLKSLSAAALKHLSIRVVLHTGTKLVDNPEEQPLSGFDDTPNNQLTIDWSVRKTCPTDDVLAGRCTCRRRNVTVDIWIANDIRLEDLSIPPGLEVESGREIEHFIERRSTVD